MKPQMPVFVVGAFLGFLALVWYANHTSTATVKSEEQQNAGRDDSQMFSDIRFAASEMKRRLRGRVKLVGGTLVIKTDLGFVAFPRSVPWNVSCDIGVSVLFGGIQDNEITLTDYRPRADQCEAIAVSLAEEVQQILGAN